MRTLTEVVQILEQWETEHQPYDRVTRLPIHQFVQEGQGGALVPMAEASTLPEMHLQDHALGQLLGRMEYPRKLYQRLPTKMNMLALNWLIQNGAYDKDCMLRLINHNQVRALLSSRFAPFDHLELLRLLEPQCGDGVVRWEHLDDLTLHISISFPQQREEVRVGDVVERGLHVTNSELGVRAVTITGYTMVLKCANGMIGRGDNGDSFRFRHTGSHDRLRGMVSSAVETTMLEAHTITAKLKAALEQEVAQPFEYIERLAKERGDITQDEFKRILTCYMSSDNSDTLYDVAQAISASANVVEGEDRYKLQRFAVDVL